MKNILILGGTNQVGRLLIEKILTLNLPYEITLFNRGVTNSDLFPSIKKIVGDRETDDVLKICNSDWDVVIDISCYSPFSLQKIVEKLKGRIGRYIFISTISAYDFHSNIGIEKVIDEAFPFKKYTPEHFEAAGMINYGQKKRAAEEILLSEPSLDKIIFRPHFIYGKYDWQNMDYYWFYRFKFFNEMLLPNNGSDLMTWSFVDDTIDILIKSISIKEHRTDYNLISNQPISQKGYLEILEKIYDKKPTYIPISTEQLLANNIRPIFDIPLWSNGNYLVFSNEKIVADFNHTFKPFTKTIEDTYNCYNQNSNWSTPKRGIKREREVELISRLNK